MNADGAGDARFTATDTDVIDSSLDYLTFGRDEAEKNAVNYGSVVHYDTSVIPLGAVVNKAKLVMRAYSSDAVASTPSIDVLSINPRLNATEFQTHDALLNYSPDSSFFADTNDSLWDEAQHSTGDAVHLRLYANRRNGMSSVAQAWTANASGALVYHWFRAYQSGIASQNLFVRANVYEAIGSAGTYRKGRLLDRGKLMNAYLLPTSVNTLVALEPSGGWGSWSATAGKRYVTEFERIGVLESGDAYVGIRWQASADGSAENVSTYADMQQTTPHRLQGFGSGGIAPQWESGNALKVASAVGSSDNPAMPSFTAGNAYEFGDGYSGLTELENFKSNIQSVLSAREDLSDWVGVRIMDFSTTGSGAWRRPHSSNSSTATIGSLSGIVLVIDYSLPFRSYAISADGASSVGISGSGASLVALEASGVAISSSLFGASDFEGET